jgi:hypothetical protein
MYNVGMDKETKRLDNYLKVLEIAKLFGISPSCIYESIRIDPTFPYINLGPRKNYRINPDHFEKWLHKQSRYKSPLKLSIPTALELLKEVKGNE